MASSGELHVTT